MTLPAKIDFSKAQLLIIRNMCAKDCTDSEFDLFLEVARARGLNPLTKQIYASIVNKDSKDARRPRQLVIMVAIDGLRVIASRTGNYRPDNKSPRFETDTELRNPNTNPSGLFSAEVGVYVHSHGDWHYTPQVALWEEYAPVIDEWAEDPATGKRAPTGRQILDPKKPNWRKMPRVMLAKVAESVALRKAFPESYSGLYGEEELDRTHSQDVSASQLLEEARREHRQSLIGGPGIMIDWMDGKPLDKVPFGQFFDRAMQFVKANEGAPMTLKAWTDRNRHPLREFWSHAKGDADELKRVVEKAMIANAEFYPDDEPAEPVAKTIDPETAPVPPLRKLRLRD